MIRKRHVTLAAVCVALSAAAASNAFAESNKAFMKKAIEGDNSEVHLGQIAAQKGASQSTRDFGNMLVMDHGKHKAEALPLAQQLGVQPTDDIDPEAKSEARKLDRLSGPAFDHEFARYMVKDHKKDIADYEKEAKKHDQTGDFARQTLPTLQKHLDTAQQLVSQT